MSVLEISKLYKVEQDKCVIPKISMVLGENESIVIKSNREIMEKFALLLERKELPSSGNIQMDKDALLVIRPEDAVYENFTVKEYLKIFHIMKGKNDKFEILMDEMCIRDIQGEKIGHLTGVQRQCVFLAKAWILNPKVLILLDTPRGVSRTGMQVYATALTRLKQHLSGGILTFCSNLEDAMEIRGDLPINLYDYNGYRILEDSNENAENMASNETETIEKPLSAYYKISCKFEDSILLFTPSEIDYCESIEGETYVHVDTDSYLAQMEQLPPARQEVFQSSQKAVFRHQTRLVLRGMK